MRATTCRRSSWRRRSSRARSGSSARTIPRRRTEPVARLSWPPIIDVARTWVEGQEFPVTLRQLFYHLVSIQLIPNRYTAYKRLSDLTAKQRYVGEFPDLEDRTRR